MSKRHSSDIAVDVDETTEAEAMLYDEIADDPTAYIIRSLGNKMQGKKIDEDALMMAGMLVMAGALKSRGIPMDTIEAMIDRDFEIRYSYDGEALNVKWVFLDEDGNPLEEVDSPSRTSTRRANDDA